MRCCRNSCSVGVSEVEVEGLVRLSVGPSISADVVCCPLAHSRRHTCPPWLLTPGVKVKKASNKFPFPFISHARPLFSGLKMTRLVGDYAGCLCSAAMLGWPLPCVPSRTVPSRVRWIWHSTDVAFCQWDRLSLQMWAINQEHSGKHITNLLDLRFQQH